MIRTCHWGQISQHARCRFCVQLGRIESARIRKATLVPGRSFLTLANVRRTHDTAYGCLWSLWHCAYWRPVANGGPSGDPVGTFQDESVQDAVHALERFWKFSWKVALWISHWLPPETNAWHIITQSQYLEDCVSGQLGFDCWGQMGPEPA